MLEKTEHTVQFFSNILMTSNSMVNQINLSKMLDISVEK